MYDQAVHVPLQDEGELLHAPGSKGAPFQGSLAVGGQGIAGFRVSQGRRHVNAAEQQPPSILDHADAAKLLIFECRCFQVFHRNLLFLVHPPFPPARPSLLASARKYPITGSS